MDLMRLADILVNKIKRDYRDDVAVVQICGSYLYGDNHNRSDLDIFFVPKTPRGNNLSCSLIIDGIGCDFWAISWERLENIASHKEHITSIITGGRLIYYASDEDLERFEKLKSQALEGGDQNAWLARAREALDKAYKDGFLIQNAESLSKVRTHAIALIYNLSFALAQLNHISIKRIRRFFKPEIMNMALIPENFAALYDEIFLSSDMQTVQKSCAALIKNSEKLFEEAPPLTQPQNVSDVFDGWYEEMIQSYNKIYHACETGDRYTPLFAAAELSFELDDALKRTGIICDLPDVAAAYDSKNLDNIAAVAREHQSAVEGMLRENGIQLLTFSTFEDVEHYFDAK
jgi:hypothetical protein